MIRRSLIPLFILMIAVTSEGAAQSGRDELTPERRAIIVDSIASALNGRYVFPEVAAKMAADLRSRVKRGAFDAITDVSAFGQILTKDLQAVSHDKHVRVRVGGSGQAGGRRPIGSDGPTGAFGRAERLAGDVAYVEILSFGFSPEDVRDEASRIMGGAADARALILDLRANGGGSPFMVALVASYVFGSEPVLLNSLYFRPANRTDDFFTEPQVSGKKFGPTKPVFVLTSSRTFSGAEEFAYDLQTQKRATIVGETTGGGANPGGPVSLPYGMTLFVPTGRAINPITKTNWEGTGVKPDVAVPADSALAVAHRLAQKAVTGPQRASP